MHLKELELAFERHRNHEKAEQMSAYMKNKFSYYGIQAPVRKSIFKEVKAQHPISKSEWKSLVTDCFNREEREWQYTALEFVEASRKFWVQEDLAFLEDLVTKKSWWDTVDWLAGTIGRFYNKYPDPVLERAQVWNTHDDMWLNRVSILFQLHQKEGTDWPLLQRYILTHKDSKEFFIQKAQGWALRQYAKINPRAVLKFLEENPDLSNLTKREASKHLK